MHSKQKTEPLRILVADPVEASRTMTSALLQTAGHAVAAVPQGEAVLAQLAVNKFDLILLDIMMPGLDGFKTVRNIKRQNIKAPVFALTSYTDIQDQQLYRTAGFDATLSKPLKLTELEHALALYQGESLIPVFHAASDAPHGKIDSNIPLLDRSLIEHLKRSITAQRLSHIRRNYWQSVQVFLDYTQDLLTPAIRGDLNALTSFREYVHELKGASVTLGLQRVGDYASYLQNAPPGEILRRLHLLIKALLQSRAPLAAALAEPVGLIRTG